MASFFAREKDLTVTELNELLEEAKKELSDRQKKEVMEAFALYLLKSVIWLTGFALVYIVFLKNERFFELNRIFLIIRYPRSIDLSLHNCQLQGNSSGCQRQPV